MSDDFGSYLKHQRELRGIQLDEIAQATKINHRLLQALEESRFEDLPGEVFIKGFIRSYGQAIGSNVDELLTAYMESAGKTGPKPSSVPDSEKPEPSGKAPQAASSPPVKALVGFGLALALIIGGVFWVTSEQEPSSTRVSPPSSPAGGEAAPPLKIDNSLPELPVEPAPAGDSGSTDAGQTQKNPKSESKRPAESSSAGPSSPSARKADTGSIEGKSGTNKNTVTVSEKNDIIKDLQDQTVSRPAESSGAMPSGDQSLTLVIRVSENSWFNLAVDDQRDQDFILPAGGSKTIRAQNAIVMTIGNRRATQLGLNGNPLVLPESPDNVIRNFIVNADQIEN